MAGWTAFVWAAILIAATAGFGYGIASAAAPLLSPGAGPWLPGLVQAHGHVQIFGWGGLMVLGVGFFFLPRLRGAPLAHPQALPWILTGLASGLVLRAAAAPLGAAVPGSLAAAVALISALLELAAGTGAVWVLGSTARRGPSMRQRTGMLPVLPYIVLAFVAMWVALALNLLFVVQGLGGAQVLSRPQDDAVIMLGLDGFLVPVSVAVAARSFPLFLWVKVPDAWLVRLLFWPFAAGLVLRLVAGAAASPVLGAAGSLLEGAALVAIPVLLGVVPLRRRAGNIPASDPHYLRAVEYLLVPAFGWLLAAGLVQVMTGLSLAGVQLPVLADLERHALGSGFVTLLIMGMGQRMLPGFGGRTLWSPTIVWATALLGNASALFRGGAILAAGLGWVPAGSYGWVSASIALSGMLGVVAALLFGVNLWVTFRRPIAGPARA